MVYRWFIYRKQQRQPQSQYTELPKVTVQVPLYNERFVAERIINACASLDYPLDKLHIQIVDDSTDATVDIVDNAVQLHRVQGINIEQVRRANRKGYKSGALHNATTTAQGEFIAIFDADFVPEPDWLKQSIHYFKDSSIGVVQSRWQHLNANNSPLTSIQTVALDAHFRLEQHIRSSSNMLLNFNGTAGIWRKQAIIDSGGWSDDTLTEDLDLSYRAQLKGWRLLYLNQLGCEGEIPATMNDFKSQQHRWAKGAVEVLLKLLVEIWKSGLSRFQKVEATFHLANNLAYLVLLLDILIFLIPAFLIRQYLGWQSSFQIDLVLTVIATLGHLTYLAFGQIAKGLSVVAALSKVPRLLLLGIQLTVNNSIAVLEALTGKKTAFIRTPKRGSQNISTIPWYKVRAPGGVWFEITLGILFTLLIVPATVVESWLSVLLFMLLSIGFISSGVMSYRNA